MNQCNISNPLYFQDSVFWYSRGDQTDLEFFYNSLTTGSVALRKSLTGIFRNQFTVSWPYNRVLKRRNAFFKSNQLFGPTLRSLSMACRLKNVELLVCVIGTVVWYGVCVNLGGPLSRRILVVTWASDWRCTPCGRSSITCTENCRHNST